MAQVDIAQTVSKMKRASTTTFGWDVVVNYCETEINKLLANDFKGRDTKQIKDISCQITGINMQGDDYTIDFHFELSSPLISFSTTRTTAVCNLAVPIVGGYSKTEAVTQPIKSGVYTMHINTLELASASGDNNNYTPPNKTFVFPSTKSEGFVVIDMKASESLTVDFTTGEGFPADAYNTFIKAYKARLADELKTKLRNNFLNVRYELARVKSDWPTAGMVDLVPRSFRFAAYEPGDSACTVLSLFIRTREGEHGKDQYLDQDWNQQWRSTIQCSPIPTGQTASIIFNKDMIFDKVIRPALSKQDFDYKLCNTIGDITLDIDTKKVVYRAEFKDPGEGVYRESKRVSEINATPPHLLLKFYSEDGPMIYCFKTWKYSYDFEWECFLTGPAVARLIGGKVKVTHDLTNNNPTSFESLLDDYGVRLECTIDKGMWGVDLLAHEPSFWDKIAGGMGIIPGWITDLNVELPNFKIELGSFDFFLTTNLLLPSRTSEAVIKVDQAVGLKIPGDLYIVGKVAAS